MDYFDRVVAAGARVEVKTLPVEELWLRRFDLYTPRKRNYSALFFNAFEDLVRQTHGGRAWDHEAMERHLYWDYIRWYHRAWREDPLTERARAQMRHRFRDGVNLYRSLRDEGMRDPLGMIVYPTYRHLYRGYRRLVILHVLGTEEAEVAHAYVDHHTGPE